MTKTFIMLLAFCTFGTCAYSQSILLNIKGNDCAKCQLILGSILKKKEIPIFYIFPSAFKKDPGEITSQLLVDNTKGAIVYSDKYDKLTKGSSSTISYLSSTGKLEFKKSIGEIENNDAQMIDSLYMRNIEKRGNPALFEKYYGGWKSSKNYATAAISVDSGDIHLEYRADSITTELCKNAIDRVIPNFYAKTKNEKDSLGVPASMLRSKLAGYTIHDGKFYFIIEIPAIIPPTENGLKMGLKGEIGKFKCMVVMKPNTPTRYFPLIVEQPPVNKDDSYIFNQSSFMVVNDSTFNFFYYPDNWRLYPFQHSYIASFKLENEIIKFSHHLKNSYPSFFFEKGIGYTVAPSFRVADYPYFVPTIGTQISDLSTGLDYKFNPPYAIDYSRIDSLLARKLVSGQLKPPVENLYFINNAINQELFLFVKIDSTYYLQIFNSLTHTLTRTLNLNQLSIQTAEYPVFNFDSQKSTLYIEDRNNILRSLPIELLSEAML